ncbi:MAG: hypothetical protein HC923_02810 [Myxococcales bacterium]|nr:hypothetical protein [Myxococcales bacterium]
MKLWISALLLLGLGCGHSPSPDPAPPATGPIPASEGWWRDAVFYEIFVRSFADSDGDGIGDFRGLIDKLDVLNDGDPTTTTDLGGRRACG